MSNIEEKTSSDLKINYLKNELEKRGLDKTGIKTKRLIGRLPQTLLTLDEKQTQIYVRFPFIASRFSLA